VKKWLKLQYTHVKEFYNADSGAAVNASLPTRKGGGSSSIAFSTEKKSSNSIFHMALLVS
jgi:hypothetical protein